MTSLDTVLCTPAEAKDLTARIRVLLDEMDGVAIRLHPLLLVAHEREAWRALSYKTWELYVAAEFQIERRQSYRLLDLARVERTLSDAVSAPVIVPERAAREIKGSVAQVAREAQRLTRRGEDPQAAVEHAVEHQRSAPITRSPIRDGGGGADVDPDLDGVDVYRCRHCGKVGTVAMLSRCLVLEQPASENWGA